MATYILDTTTFSLMMKKDPKVLNKMASLSPTDRIVICTIVRGEVRYGLERMPEGKRKRLLEAKATNLFASTPCEPITEMAADLYARVKRETERKGMPLDENDLWIAATALSLGAILVTTDEDFQRIDGLIVENWKH